jgi:hypothetical protein
MMGINDINIPGIFHNFLFRVLFSKHFLVWD